MKRFSGPIPSGAHHIKSLVYKIISQLYTLMAQGTLEIFGSMIILFSHQTTANRLSGIPEREQEFYFHALPGGTWGDLLDKIPQHEHSLEVSLSQAPSEQHALQLYKPGYHRRYWSNSDGSKPVQSQVWWPLLQEESHFQYPNYGKGNYQYAQKTNL